VLVDEAHNLVERTRQMYSAEAARQLRCTPAALAAPEALRAPLLAPGASHTAPGCGRRSALHAAGCRPRQPLRWPCTVAALQRALAEHFRQHPLALGAHAGHALRVAAVPKPAGRLERTLAAKCQTSAGQGLVDAMLAVTSPVLPLRPTPALHLRNVAPACFLRPRFQGRCTA
jgi:hypothetical protein